MASLTSKGPIRVSTVLQMIKIIDSSTMRR